MGVLANEGEGCEVKEATRPSLTLTAELLGVECDELEKALVSKTMSVGLGFYGDNEHEYSMRRTSGGSRDARLLRPVIVVFPILEKI